MGNLNSACWWPNCECKTEDGDPCKYEHPDFYVRKAEEMTDRKLVADENTPTANAAIEAIEKARKTSAEIISNGRDAMKWAEDFIVICPGADKLDQMTVFCWFANAIETQYFVKSPDTPEAQFFADTQAELSRARLKFPSATASTVALMEEVGELAQAMLKYSAGKWPHSRVMEEAVQVAAMAMRVALEGDESLAKAQYTEPGE